MPELEADIQRDEIATDPFESQALHRSSRIRIFQERYGFFISERNDVLIIEDNEPTTYVTPRPKRVYSICAPSEIVVFLGVIIKDENMK